MDKSRKTKLMKLTRRLRLIKAEEVMTKGVITITEDMPLAEVAEVMIGARISGLPVIGKRGKIAGVITATDLFIVMDMIEFGDIVGESGKAVFNPKVKFAMSTEVVKIKKTTTLEEIINIIKYKNVHTLPVFMGQKMVGVIGRRDVFKHFYQAIKDLNL